MNLILLIVKYQEKVDLVKLENVLVNLNNLILIQINLMNFNKRKFLIFYKIIKILVIYQINYNKQMINNNIKKLEIKFIKFY